MKSILKEIRAIAHRRFSPRPTRFSRQLPFGLACTWVMVFASSAWAKIEINKEFNPITINPSQPSKITIRLFNNKATPVTSATFTDNLPAGVIVATPLNLVNSCGGTVTNASGGALSPGDTSIKLTGGTIPASAAVSGECSITVDVTSNTTATNTQTYVNSIPVNGLTGEQDGTTLKSSTEANATLTVEPIKPVTGSKAFSVGNLHGNGTATTMTITINNPNLIDLTAVAFIDNLPASTKVAPTPNIQNTCSGTVTATAGSSAVSLASGTIAPKAACTIKVDLVAADSNTFLNQSFTNTIPVGAITTAQGAKTTNTAALTAPITVQTGAEVKKAFNPSTIQGGETSQLTITINNYNSTAITNADLTDPIPANVTVQSLDSNSCGGTATFTASQVQLTNGTIPAAPAPVGAGSCQIKVTVTSTKKANYTNTIPAGKFGTVNYGAATANLNVLAPVSVGKAFSPNKIIRGQETTLTITLTNTDSNPANITSFTDDLTTMGTGYTVSGAATTTCVGGTVNAPNGGTLIQMNSGQIPAKSGSNKGSCTITVKVKADDLTGQGGNGDGNVTNKVPPGNLKTDLGDNPYQGQADLFLNGKVQLEKSFSDTQRTQGQETTLTIKLINTQPADVNVTSFTDNLNTMGAGFTIASSSTASTNCGGALTAAAGTTQIAMSGGKIPASSFCTITVPVKVSITAPSGSHTNTINVDELKTSIGNNAIRATANLNVKNAVVVSKAFNPPAVAVGGKSRLTITIDREEVFAPNFTGMNLTDTLPAGHTVDATPNVSNNCGGGVSASGATISLTGGALSGDKCQISVDVRVPNSAGTATNTIAAAALKTDQGATNEFAVNADIKRTAATLNLNKSFAPIKVSPGQSSRLSVLIKNNDNDAIDLTGVSFIDNLPLGMDLAAVPNPTFTGSGCSNATFTAVPADNKVIVSGASVVKDATCTLAVDVVSNFAGNLTNVLNSAIVSSSEQVTNANLVKATLTVLGRGDLTVTKTDGKKFIAAGQTTVYTIVVTNSQPVNGGQWDNIAGIDVIDTAPAGVTFTSWTCSATAGSGCAVAAGTGDVNTSVTLLKSGQATILINAKLADNIAKGTKIKNIASVDLPSTVTDPDQSSNTATDENTVGGNPNVLLVKRITALNGGTKTNGGDNLAGYMNEASNPYDDNTIEPALAPQLPQYPTADTDKWPNPSTFLIGGVNGGNVKPGDELEYTIYFLSTGDNEANQVLFCDRIPNNTTFIPTAKAGDPQAAPGGLPSADRGIIVRLNGQNQTLTNAQDGDIGRYFPPSEDPVAFYASQNPSRQIKCGGANTNGAVVVDLGTLPSATGSGTPTGSYGFVRFRGRVK
ncbi:beta strand repeat-containing protein [Fortiea contorta]|uniref:beta strand repeat-containing protein n=1 Tax=Fortiea contorta TaxID=1892405 RepID=UPI0003453D75|nr:DUF11 domain-containing protein [Fortiea contorta]